VKAFWESTQEQILDGYEAYISNDPTRVEDEPKGEYGVAPAGGEILIIPTSSATDMSADWRRGVMGAEEASTVHNTLGEVRRFGVLHDKKLAVVGNLAAPLIVEGLQEVQVVLLIEGRNYGAPRQDFES